MSARVISPAALDRVSPSNLPGPSTSGQLPPGSTRGFFPGMSDSRRRVVKNLFGDTDPKSSQYAREKVMEMKLKDSIKWNFDFDREVPLEGKYNWEAVGFSNECENPVPAAYACSRLPYISRNPGCIERKQESLFRISPTSTKITSSPVSTKHELTVCESQRHPSESSSQSSSSPYDSPPRIDLSRIPTPPAESSSSSSTPSSPTAPTLLLSDSTVSSVLSSQKSKTRKPDSSKSKQTTVTDFLPIKRKATGPPPAVVAEKKTAL